LKLFAYHAGNNGVSHYRIWQPLKYLARMGWDVKRPPDRLDRVQWDGLTGPCNVPGIPSHAEICDQYPVIMSNFTGDVNSVTRLQAQSELTNLVIDVDDDIINIDQNNPAQHLKAWTHKEQDIAQELEPGKESDPETIAIAQAHGLRIVQADGKWYLWKFNRSGSENAQECMKAAKLLTVSTPRLAEVYKHCNANIKVIPNAIDPEIWPENAKATDGFIRLGLFGSNTHHPDWREIVDVLKELLDEYPNVRLVFNCWYIAKSTQGASMAEQDKTPQFPEYFSKAGLVEHPQVEWCEPCEIADYPAWLADKAVDIGLAPLKKSAFNRGKSGIKYLEWGVLGVPGVYADQEPYSIVKNGETGFLCGKASEWKSKIKRLIEDADLRQKMGAAARADVIQNHHAKDHAAKLAEAIKEIVQ